MPEEYEEGLEEQEEPSEEPEHDDASRGVSSTMVSAIGFDRLNNLLLVDFVNGHAEAYPVSPDQWEEIKLAPSIGKWLHENVM